jgi:hypothetical protein
MVLVRTVPNAFHARVIAARLGAEGIPAELRGGVGGPYPIGDVSVWVREDDFDTAREILLADEVESAFEEALPPSPRRPFLFGLSRSQLVALVAIVVILFGALLSRVAG